MFLNVSKYLRKLESNDGSPLKRLRDSGFFTEDCGGAGVREELLRSGAYCF